MGNSSFDEPIRLISNKPNMKRIAQDFIKEKEPDEAFFFCNLSEIIKKAEEWKQTFPRVKPFYAVKCNDDEMVLKVLAGLGTGFDCASKAEMSKVLGIGVSPNDIIFANPAKMASHIRAAAANNVNVMTFDNANELHKIKQLHPSAKMVIRIRCDAEMAQCQLGMKFGVLVEDAPALLETAKELDMDVIGVSFHVGSGCMDPPVFYRAIKSAKWLFDKAANEYGFKFTMLDIGGGFPGNSGTDIKVIGDVVNGALDEFFPEGAGVDILAEPGRYFVASTFYLLTQVHSIREIPEAIAGGTGEKSFMYYINDGVYGSFNCVLYDHAVVSPQTIRLNDDDGGAKLYPASIWGPTCDGLDQVCASVKLPEIRIGEWLLFNDMGAYTIVAAGTFNGFPVPKVHYLANDDKWNSIKEMIYSEPMTVPSLSSVFLKDAEGGRDAVGWGISPDMPHPRPRMVKLSNDVDSIEASVSVIGVAFANSEMANISNSNNKQQFGDSFQIVSSGSGLDWPAHAHHQQQQPALPPGAYNTFYKTDIPAQ